MATHASQESRPCASRGRQQGCCCGRQEAAGRQLRQEAGAGESPDPENKTETEKEAESEKKAKNQEEAKPSDESKKDGGEAEPASEPAKEAGNDEGEEKKKQSKPKDGAAAAADRSLSPSAGPCAEVQRAATGDELQHGAAESERVLLRAAAGAGLLAAAGRVLLILLLHDTAGLLPAGAANAAMVASVPLHAVPARVARVLLPGLLQPTGDARAAAAPGLVPPLRRREPQLVQRHVIAAPATGGKSSQGGSFIL